MPVRMPLIKKNKRQVLTMIWGNELFHTVGGIKNCADAMENSMKVPPEIKIHTLNLWRIHFDIWQI